MKKQKVKIRIKGQGKVSRVLLAQVAPFVLMLFVGSWLTLQAGQMIDDVRISNTNTLAMSDIAHF